MSKQMEKATENAIFLDGREYTASDLYRLIGLLVGNGVYMNELAPTATNEDMSITHGTGHAWIGGVAYWNTIPFVLEIATADGSLNRYDSLMLRLDLSTNEVYAIIVQGAYATNPTPPACTRNAETFDLKLCDIYIPAGCTKITQDQITDTRLDSSVCGVPVFPVEHLDTTTFYKQINADLENFKEREQTDFANWTEEQKKEILDVLSQLENLIDADTVGHLLLEINNHTHEGVYAPAVFTYESKNGGDLNSFLNETHLFVFNVTNKPFAYNYGWFDVWRASASGFSPSDAKPIIMQRFTNWKDHGVAWRFSVDAGETFTEWAYENPPCLPGVEYLTTEFYLGEQVKTKVINCGTITGGATHKIAHNTSCSKTVRSEINVGRYTLPYIYNGDPASQFSITSRIDATHVYITAGSGLSTYETYAQIWYI